jgi:uridine kinase
MNRTYGDGTLTEALRLRVASLKADVVLIDGIRWESDLVLLRKFAKNLLVYVTAPLKVRFARTRARKEKLGESHSSFTQFKKEELVKTESFIQKIGRDAEFKIPNNGSFADFRRKVRIVANALQ